MPEARVVRAELAKHFLQPLDEVLEVMRQHGKGDWMPISHMGYAGGTDEFGNPRDLFQEPHPARFAVRPRVEGLPVLRLDPAGPHGRFRGRAAQGVGGRFECRQADARGWPA